MLLSNKEALLEISFISQAFTSWLNTATFLHFYATVLATTSFLKIKVMEQRHPLPPFTMETASQKVQMAEDAWNSKDPEKVSLAYSVDTEWRNRAEFISGREAVREFLKRKWARELDYKLKKELWGFRENRMAVRFEYEWHDDSGKWYRSYGNELWEFDENGLMRKRFASINDLPIDEKDRKFK